MKITKYVHACVLAEDDENTVLFDPGQFAYDSGLLQIDNLPKLDFVLITHEHYDHYHEPLVRDIMAKFPDVVFYTNPSVAEMLRGIGAKNIRTESDEITKIKHLDHQSMAPLAPLPMCDNVEIHYKGKISHPGDSQQIQSTEKLLFVPLAGPWAAAIDGVRMADRLKPEYILPIHDWMWNDTWRQIMYGRMEEFFGKQGIKVLKPVDGQALEVEL